MDKLFIHEDITDWKEEAFREELIITSEKDILDALSEGTHTAKVARATSVSREMGKAPTDIIRPNKVLLTIGAMADVISIAHKTKADVHTKDGAVYQIPALVGRGQMNEFINALTGEEQDENEPDADTGPSFVKINDPLALGRNERYFRTVITGHIWKRLLRIHESGGDVRAIADELKAKIDEFVQRIG